MVVEVLLERNPLVVIPGLDAFARGRCRARSRSREGGFPRPPSCGMRGARDKKTCGRPAPDAEAELVNDANLLRRSRLYIRSARSDGDEGSWRRHRGRSRCRRERPNRRRERHYEGFQTFKVPLSTRACTARLQNSPLVRASRSLHRSGRIRRWLLKSTR
jgi:hypothetical protein